MGHGCFIWKMVHSYFHFYVKIQHEHLHCTKPKQLQPIIPFQYLTPYPSNANKLDQKYKSKWQYLSPSQHSNKKKRRITIPNAESKYTWAGKMQESEICKASRNATKCSRMKPEIETRMERTQNAKQKNAVSNNNSAIHSLQHNLLNLQNHQFTLTLHNFI